MKLIQTLALPVLLALVLAGPCQAANAPSCPQTIEVSQKPAVIPEGFHAYVDGNPPTTDLSAAEKVELNRIERQRASAERRDDDEDEDRGPQGPHQPSRIRGSTTVYRTSTARLTSAKLIANTRSAPWISA